MNAESARDAALAEAAQIARESAKSFGPLTAAGAEAVALRIEDFRRALRARV